MSVREHIVDGCDGLQIEPGDLPAIVTEVWHNYEQGYWDGSGWIVCLLDDGRWTIHDMSHGSCYGPLEYLQDLDVSYDDPQRLMALMTDEARLWAKPVFDLLGWSYVPDTQTKDSAK